MAKRGTAKSELGRNVLEDPAPHAPDDFTAIERGFFDQATAAEEAGFAETADEAQPPAFRRGWVAGHSRSLLAAVAGGVLLVGGALWGGTGGARTLSAP